MSPACAAVPAGSVVPPRPVVRFPARAESPGAGRPVSRRADPFAENKSGNPRRSPDGRENDQDVNHMGQPARGASPAGGPDERRRPQAAGRSPFDPARRAKRRPAALKPHVPRRGRLRTGRVGAPIDRSPGNPTRRVPRGERTKRLPRTNRSYALARPAVRGFPPRSTNKWRGRAGPHHRPGRRAPYGMSRGLQGDFAGRGKLFARR